MISSAKYRLVHPERSDREASAQSKGARSAGTGALRLRASRSAQGEPVALSILLLFAAACGPRPVTYRQDVEPLLQARCASCHQEGGIGPFALETYEQATQQAGAIKAVTQSRQMPPWGVDGSGACQKWSDSQWLSDTELDVLARWADEGQHPLGTAGMPLVSAPVAFEPTHTLDPAVDYALRTDLTDDYRCFIVDPGLTEDRFVTAYRVDPGDARVVHHVILYAAQTEAQDAAAAQLDAAEAGPGYTCFGGPGFSARPVVGWAPGTGVTRYPEQTGVRLLGGRKLIMQVHYNTRLGVGVDRTRVALELAADVPIEATIVPLADPSLEVPPGQAEVSQVSELSLPLPLRVKVRGVFPHMHKLGRKLKVELLRSEKWQCAVDVPRWDFNWQRFYFYQTPLAAVPGDSLRLSCSYDTSGRTSPVTWGEGTDDEMCLVGLYVTPR